MFVNTFINLISNLMNIALLSDLLQKQYNLSPLLSKIAMLLLFSAILFLIVEPEKLKILTSLSLIVYSVITMMFFGDAVGRSFGDKDDKGNLKIIENFRFGGVGLFLGVGSYAYESIGTIFNGIGSVVILS